MSARPTPALVVDVGGTNTRIAGADGTALERYRNDDFDAFEAVIERYLADTGASPDGIYISAAGPAQYGEDETVGAEELTLTNRGWHIRRRDLQATGFGRVRIYNDLHAAAKGADSLLSSSPEAFRALIGESFTSGPFATVGLGTGTGCAVVRDHHIYGTEAGHIPAALDAETARAFAEAGLLTAHPKYERVISGTGLKTLIKLFAPEGVSRPADLLAAASDGNDEARHILDIFHTVLGRFLTTVVVGNGLRRVVIVSDFLRGWGAALDVDRIADEFLSDVPAAYRSGSVALLDHDDVPLAGLRAFAAEGSGDPH